MLQLLLPSLASRPGCFVTHTSRGLRRISSSFSTTTKRNGHRCLPNTLRSGHTRYPRRKREVKRFVDLTGDETTDLWLTAHKIGHRLESYHKASSLTFTIQDGPQAGQSVPHVHIHILPRKAGDFERNDDVYDAIDNKEKQLKEKLDLDKERRDRSLEEMTQEADEYRKLL